MFPSEYFVAAPPCVAGGGAVRFQVPSHAASVYVYETVTISYVLLVLQHDLITLPVIHEMSCINQGIYRNHKNYTILET